MTDQTAAEALRELLERNPELAALNPEEAQSPLNKARAIVMAPKPSKYRSARTEYNGHKYHSQKEAEHAALNDQRLQAGELIWWARQVEFPLAGGIVYRADFVEMTADGVAHVVEVKAWDRKLEKFRHTVEYNLKWRLLRERYPKLVIEEV